MRAGDFVDNNIDNIKDELAAKRPKQSVDNPIPQRTQKRQEEEKQHNIEECEKDYYASQKPKKTGQRKKGRTIMEDNDEFMQALHEPTVIVERGLKGKFSEIYTDDIYLQSGEHCYFVDAVQLLEQKVVKEFIGKSIGHSVPGLFKGSRWGSGVSWRKEIGEHEEHESYFGMLYVTNKRTIFVEKEQGFDKKHTSISAIIPFSNGLKIQYGSKTYFLVLDRALELYELYESLH